MRRCFFTVSTADHFQYYIPMYVAALRTWSTDDIVIHVRGKLDPVMTSNQCTRIIDEMYTDYPYNVSTTNALRFVAGIQGYDRVIITDLDMLLFEDPWPWHSRQLHDYCFVGHRGPTKRPHRPEICSSWTGDFERVAGGVFMVTDKWYAQTHLQRTLAAKRLYDGVDGLYREADEVMLANIIKRSGLMMPQSKYFPPALRGIHIGDFKFDHRWQNDKKMGSLLTVENCEKYGKIKAVVNEMRKKSPEVDKLMANVETYIAKAIK